MKTKKEEMFNVLSENEQKKVIGGLFPPPKKESENKFPYQKHIEQLLSGAICW